MAPRDGGPPPSPDGPGTRLWSECARAVDSGSPRNPWVSWGGEHRSTRIRVPAKSQISWGWEMARGKGPPRSEDATGRIRGSHEACFVGWIRGSHEACFVGWIGVRDPVILLQRPPKRKAATLPPAGQGAPWLAEPPAL